MSLPTSGPISFSMVNIELFKAATTSGTFDDTDFRTLAGIPSGAISMSDQYGKSSVTVGGSDYFAFTENLIGAGTQATLRFDEDGFVWASAIFSGAQEYKLFPDWIDTPSANIGDDYEILYTNLVDNTGSNGSYSGFTTTWQSLSSADYPTVTCNSEVSAGILYDFSIRRAGTTTVLSTDTASVGASSVDTGGEGGIFGEGGI